MKKPSMKASIFVAGVMLAKSALAQLPVEKEPHHKIIFENEFARVIDLEVSPGDTTSLHTHSAASAVVFMSASTFAIRNVGQAPVVTTVRAGDAVYRSYDEVPATHTVWCEDQTKFRCLVVECKKQPLNKSHHSTLSGAKLLWQNTHMNAHRLDLPAHGTCLFPTSSQAYVFITFTGTIAVRHPGKEITIKEGGLEIISGPVEVANPTNAAAGAIILQLN